MESRYRILSSRPFQILSLVVLAGFLTLGLYALSVIRDTFDVVGNPLQESEVKIRGTDTPDPLITPTLSYPRVSLTDPVKGASNAKVTIIGYEDYSCPHCSGMVDVMNDVLELYPDTVRYVIKEYPPTDNIEDSSYQAANAARCADRYGKFWEYHDRLFINPFGLDSVTFLEVASQLGIPSEVFQSCLDQQTYIPLIKDNVTEGKGLQIEGTPYYFINDQEIPGTATVLDFKTVIDDVLSKLDSSNTNSESN